MDTIGYLANVSSESSPFKTLSDSVIYRAVIMDKILRNTYNVQLFIYNLAEIQDLNNPLVPGYIIEDKAFVPCKAPLPKINGNWLHRLQQYLDEGVGYKNFNEWRKKHNIEIYADFDFASITYSKLRTFSVIEKFQAGLHPYTEKLDNPEQQIKKFMQNYDIIFLKPDQGNQGKDIIVLRKINNHWHAKHHTHKIITEFNELNADEIIEKITPFLIQHHYLIQQGIETIRYQQRPFDVRVIMVDDGKQWNYFDHVRIGSAKGELSYTPQDWQESQAKRLLQLLFPPDRADQLHQTIRQTSYALTEYLTHDFQSKVMELAYDIIIDKQGKIYLAEINTKPGMWFKEKVADIFNVQDHESYIYLHQLVPHARACAEFLVSKLSS